MVFISPVIFIARPKPGPHRFWKRRRILSLAGHFYGRSRRCYSIAIRIVHRSFFHSQHAARLRKHLLRKIWEARLKAACVELDTNFPAMRKVLQEAGIGLDRKTLQHFAIWEPRTFRGLAILTKAKTEVQGLNSIEPPPKGVVTRGML